MISSSYFQAPIGIEDLWLIPKILKFKIFKPPKTSDVNQNLLILVQNFLLFIQIPVSYFWNSFFRFLLSYSLISLNPSSQTHLQYPNIAKSNQLKSLFPQKPFPILINSNPIQSSPSTSKQSPKPKDEIDHEPDYWILKLKDEGASVSLMTELMDVIAGQTNEWVNEFVAKGGIPAVAGVLIPPTNESSGAQSEDEINLQFCCVDCILSILNTSVGMAGFINEREAVRKLTLLFDIEDLRVKTSVMFILATVACYSQAGLATTLDAVSYYRNSRKEKARFNNVVNALRIESDQDFRVSCDYLWEPGNSHFSPGNLFHVLQLTPHNTN